MCGGLALHSLAALQHVCCVILHAMCCQLGDHEPPSARPCHRATLPRPLRPASHSPRPSPGPATPAGTGDRATRSAEDMSLKELALLLDTAPGDTHSSPGSGGRRAPGAGWALRGAEEAADQPRQRLPRQHPQRGVGQESPVAAGPHAAYQQMWLAAAARAVGLGGEGGGQRLPAGGDALSAMVAAAAAEDVTAGSGAAGAGGSGTQGSIVGGWWWGGGGASPAGPPRV